MRVLDPDNFKYIRFIIATQPNYSDLSHIGQGQDCYRLAGKGASGQSWGISW